MNDGVLWALMLEFPDGTYEKIAVFTTWRAATQTAVAQRQRTGSRGWRIKESRRPGPYRVPPLVQLAEAAE